MESYKGCTTETIVNFYTVKDFTDSLGVASVYGVLRPDIKFGGSKAIMWVYVMLGVNMLMPVLAFLSILDTRVYIGNIGHIAGIAVAVAD